ncbi:Zn-ribbon domain-containing OB-fold protein [Streptomyces sp. NPDC048305]|uniref:Zn-ribbon domain-containing OB-fold protein n=1 Tax=Streptomyces sp. NPDC048305 TaxID=3365532 RepID=UPI003723DFF5
MSSSDTLPAPRQVGAEWTHQDGQRTTLTITTCKSCASRWFPPRDTCSTCASAAVENISSETQGTVYASSVVQIAPRGFQAPYVLAYIDISGVRLLAHCPTADHALAPGTPVELTVGPIAHTSEGAVTSYVVTPVGDTPHTPTGEQR